MVVFGGSTEGVLRLQTSAGGVWRQHWKSPAISDLSRRCLETALKEFCDFRAQQAVFGDSTEGVLRFQISVGGVWRQHWKSSAISELMRRCDGSVWRQH